MSDKMMRSNSCRFVTHLFFLNFVFSNQNTMKRQFSIIILLLLLVLPGSIAHAAGSTSNIRVDYSCPGKVTVTYDLTTAQPTDITLQYSPNKSKWLDAEAVTGDVKAQTTGTGKTIVWDCFADNVRTGGFYFRIELPLQPEPDCVWINGVCWATRNVDEPGTFAANPEDAGKFYQWNRKTAWAATGTVTGWDNTASTGTTWETANNVCPTGYRVPTNAEIQSLVAAGNQWTTQSGVNGCVFGSGDNTIFLPAAGRRYGDDGALSDAGSWGSYWSSTQGGSLGAYSLGFGSSLAHWVSSNRVGGYSVRCVADE